MQKERAKLHTPFSLLKKNFSTKLSEVEKAPKTRKTGPSAYIGTLGPVFRSKSKCLVQQAFLPPHPSFASQKPPSPPGEGFGCSLMMPSRILTVWGFNDTLKRTVPRHSPFYNTELLNSAKLLRFTLTEDFLRGASQKTVDIEAMLATSPEYNRSCMLQFQELYIQFLTQHAYEPTNYPDWLASLLLSLQDVNLFGMSMSQFASTTPYSYSRLSRLFQHYTGVSLIDYVTDVKIRHAKELLKNTNMTMLAIASKLEFSISYFNKLFKRKVGITPGEYRKKNQKM